MEANRKSRVLIVAAGALLAFGCKKGGEDRRETESPVGSGGAAKTAPADPAPGGGAADPHAGLDMGAGGGADPHAGLDMGTGGAAGDPHAGVDMSGGMGGGMAGGGAGGGKPVEMKDGKAVVGPLRLAVPKSWQNQPAGGMRAAQWTVPGPKGAGEAQLIVYYFGAGGAGSVEDNLQRWYGQFQAEGGKQVTPKTEKKKVAGMPVTVTEVEGRYVAAMMPGAAEKNDEPGWMMLAAILETPSGAYYFKMTGPKGTVGAARKDFRSMIDTVQLEK